MRKSDRLNHGISHIYQYNVLLLLLLFDQHLVTTI